MRRIADIARELGRHPMPPAPRAFIKRLYHIEHASDRYMELGDMGFSGRFLVEQFLNLFTPNTDQDRALCAELREHLSHAVD